MTERRIVAKLDDMSIVFQCTECLGELAFHSIGKAALTLDKIVRCPQCGRVWIKDPKQAELVSAFVQNIRAVTSLKEMPFTVRIQLRD